ncbi:MAG: PAS domain-containing protein [Actinomycetota bacterium]
MQDEALRRRDLIIDAVGSAAERFLKASDWRDAIDHVLREIGEATGASRVHLYETGSSDTGELTCSLRDEFAAPGIEPQISNPLEQGFPLISGGYGRWVDVLGSGDLIQGVRDEMPESERRFLEEEGIRSVLVVPIFVEDHWWGWIGFDECETDREWTAAETDALRAAAGIIGAAIQRERMEQRHHEAEAKYQALVEQIPAIVYISTADDENRTLYISPQVKDVLGYPPVDWLRKPDLWDGLVHPDERDRILEEVVRTNRSGEPFRAEYRMVTRWGKQIWIHEEAHLVLDHRGEGRYWQGVMIDVTPQKQVAEQLHEAETKYQALIEQVPVIIYTEDLGEDVAVSYMSPRVRDVLGFSAEEFMGASDLWMEQVHPEDKERVAAEAARAQRESDTYLVEYRIFTKDGRERWFYDEAALILGEEGEPVCWQGFMMDITNRKETEAALRDAEERFRNLVEQTPAITYIEAVSDDVGETLYISPQVETILGYPSEDWIEDPVKWRDLVHPDDLEAMVGSYRVGADSGAPVNMQYRMRAQDGRWVWFRDESALVYDLDGQPQFWQGVMHDITSQKETEDRMIEAEERYRTLIEQIPAAAYIDALHGSGVTIYISPQAEDLLGYTAQEWVDDPDLWERLIHPDDRDRVLEEDERVRDDQPFDMEYRMIHRDGHEVWIHDQARLVFAEDGQPRYWQGVMVDITQRRRAEDLEGELRVERETAQRLRDLDDMKNTFLTAVSHDLRTPLAAILGLSITLERDDLGLVQPDGRDLTRRISDNARKLDRLVTDLLDLDRLTRGILEPKRHPTDVGALVRKVVDEADFLGEHPVSVEAESVVLSVDGAKVERIVENLLANTARHTPSGTQVWVRVGPKDGGVLITIEDAGPGVLDELRDSVFEPFRQGEGDDSPSPSPGVGIGLSLVARFAELHGGRAWVDEREGGGASFQVFLPQSNAPTTFR